MLQSSQVFQNTHQHYNEHEAFLNVITKRNLMKGPWRSPPQPNIQTESSHPAAYKLISRTQVALSRFCLRHCIWRESHRYSLHISNSISINVVHEFSFIQFKMINSLQWKRTRAFLLSVCASTPTPTRKLTIRREIKNHLSSDLEWGKLFDKKAHVAWTEIYRCRGSAAEAGSSIESFCRLEINYTNFFHQQSARTQVKLINKISSICVSNNFLCAFIYVACH